MMLTHKALLVWLAAVYVNVGESFQIQSRQQVVRLSPVSSTVAPEEDVAVVEPKSKLAPKEQLIGLLERIGSGGVEDPVLADPFTKESIRVSSPGPVLANSRAGNIRYLLKSSSNTFEGNSNEFWNLLKPIPASTNSSGSTTTTTVQESLIRNLVPFIPPPIRSALATAGLDVGDEYVPMRDLFTSPAVSFAYERGWRQGFASAGFPGADKEAEMAMEYFEPAFSLEQESNQYTPKTLVDMSCATGTPTNLDHSVILKTYVVSLYVVQTNDVSTFAIVSTRALYTTLRQEQEV